MEAYVNFDGRCAEAFAFYEKCLDGKVTQRMTWAESPMSDQMPAGSGDKIMHATFEAGGHKLMGSDTPPSHPFQGYKGFTLALQAGNVDQGRRWFDALSDGGKVTMPYQPTFWAAGFGMFEDRFGVPWMVNCEQA